MLRLCFQTGNLKQALQSAKRKSNANIYEILNINIIIVNLFIININNGLLSNFCCTMKNFIDIWNEYKESRRAWKNLL